MFAGVAGDCDCIMSLSIIGAGELLLYPMYMRCAIYALLYTSVIYVITLKYSLATDYIE
jgi:hypothetical protein